MSRGRRTTARPALSWSLARFQADLALLPAGAREIRSPKPPTVRTTEALRRLSAETRRSLIS
jgi:hypothetical protein